MRLRADYFLDANIFFQLYKNQSSNQEYFSGSALTDEKGTPCESGTDPPL
jgi:hypothetical protein